MKTIPLRLIVKRAAVIALLVHASSAAADCDNSLSPPETDSPYTQGWGIDHRNTRYQPRSDLNAGNVERLSLKWVYGLAGQTPRSLPLVTGDSIIIGDTSRGVVALDRETGCEQWFFAHKGNITSAILGAATPRGKLLVFADRFNGIFAINADSGKLAWHSVVEAEPGATFSGTPLIVNGTVYAPVSSMEVYLATNPFYGCCTTSGGMAAFDLQSGNLRWYRPTIEEEARVTGSHFYFVQHYGPSGAPVWASPAFDSERNQIYFGTGQNYTHPTTETSDSIFAVDATTGDVNWVTQFTENDAYTAACNFRGGWHPNCAKPTGPDVDFGAPPMLVKTPSGRTILVAGQKSAEVHAMEPATGERLWTTRLGRGGIIGGVHWGLAAGEDRGMIYVPISDKSAMGFPSPGEPAPGLYALNVESGEVRWSYQREPRCETKACEFGYSGAVTAANDILVAGAMDGYLEILEVATGRKIWSHDAWREYDAVNGVETSGGAFDAHGAMLADDLLIITSGYRYVGNQRGGNALLVFQLEKKDE